MGKVRGIVNARLSVPINAHHSHQRLGNGVSVSAKFDHGIIWSGDVAALAAGGGGWLQRFRPGDNRRSFASGAPPVG